MVHSDYIFLAEGVNYNKCDQFLGTYYWLPYTMCLFLFKVLFIILEQEDILQSTKKVDLWDSTA